MTLYDEAQAVLGSAECLYTQSHIVEVISQLGAKLTAELKSQNPVVICVMNGGLMFTSQLLLHLQFPLQLEYIHATRYRERTQGGELNWIHKPSVALEGRMVLILDDILDEGYTLDAIQTECRRQNPQRLLSAVLVEKLHDRKCPDVLVDHIALTVDDRYVFGYGMDYKGYLRNMAGIYAVNDHSDNQS